ncbi:recombinase family protein [Effusibacillus consociatus]|uniref:Recombinase family protein n=1 Tax=Effusibacillus consociatus TaxID=1117041 RepID=A0ABV9Q4A5_9BACL
MELINNQRVVAYLRVSSEDQQERETIENQVEFATKYADLHKLEIVDWYKDDGVTGTIPLDARPDGNRLIEDAKAGKIDLVLIFNMKRLGRKARVTLDAVYQLEKYGVKIKSMTEPFDTGDPVGRFIITVLAGQAELDRDTTLEVLWHGANRAARKGKWLGGIVPYGYRVNDEGYLEINEDPLPGKEDMSEAGVIRLIYDLIANQKWTTPKVADYLNALHIPTSYSKDDRKVKKGKRKESTAGIWRPGRIRNMVINETYKGIHYYGKRTNKQRELIPRIVPAIVTVDVWDKAQQVLKENQIEAFRNAKRQYLLRSLIRCGTCGLTYHGTAYPDRKTKVKAYYICGGKTSYRGPYQGKCTSKNLPAEWLEERIWESCVSFIENPGEAMQELAATMQVQISKKEDFETEKSLIMKAIQDKDNEKQNILDLFRRKVIGSSDVELQFQKIEQEKLALQQRAREISEKIDEETDLADKFNSLQQLLTGLRDKLHGDMSFEVRREIVKTLVKEIEVHTEFSSGERKKPTASITTHYNFQG